METYVIWCINSKYKLVKLQKFPNRLCSENSHLSIRQQNKPVSQNI